QLQSGDNTVEVRALGDSSNIFYLDRIEVKYRRLARAADNRLSVKAENDGPLAVDGFSTADIYVFDIGNPRKPVHVTSTTVTPGAMGQSVTFTAEQGRRYLVLTGAAITSATPAPMTAADLQSSSDPVDYLIIAPPALVDAAQTLADYRQGKGLSSRVVGTDEIYDSYNWGIASPHAVRDFLRDAFHNWSVRYVVLVGIGSFDYREGSKGEPQAPTLMTSTPNGLFGCDNCLVDFDGDGAPDMAIGRIPAASAVDLQTYLTKVEAYEKGTVSLTQAGVMLLADKPDSAAGYFPQDSDWVAELLPSGIAVTRIYLDQQVIGAARSLLFEGMNRGTGWVNYLGHGGMDRFGAAGLLTWHDMGALSSTGPLPVISALTCTANRFEVPGYAPLGARLVLDADGGAIAVWASTGLSLNEPAVRLNRSLFAAVFQQQTPTLGEAVQQTLRDNTRRQDVPAYMLRIYSLLGDSALQLHH
ncbi:MAG: C25 family cysteine peptidase, partial [Candidatus Competibacter phosphatis]